MTEKIYGQFPVNQKDRNYNHEIRILAQDFKDSRVCHVREFWKPIEEEEFKPGRGISFPLSLLPQIAMSILSMVSAERGDAMPEAIFQYIAELMPEKSEEEIRALAPSLLAVATVAGGVI